MRMRNVIRRLRSCAGALGVLAGAAVPAAAVAQTTISWGKPSEVLSTDPHLSGDGTSWTVFYLIYDQLLGMTDDLKPAPGLAESWEQVSPTTYTFKLRQNAKFSNGRAVTSADVVGSLKRLLDPKLGAAWGRQLRAVKDVIAEGDHGVRIELSEPLTPLLSILSVSTTSILPMKELTEGSFDPTKGMLGSGPFMVKEHLQDESWTLDRNPNYWREGHPKVDRMVIRIMPDDTTRIAGLREGRVDFATFENPDTPRLLKGVPNVEVYIQQTPNYFRLDVSALQESSPFKDDRLRKAMSYAIDRDRMVQIIFGGESKPEYLVPAAFDPPKECREHPSYKLPRAERVKIAKDLVKQAGAENQKVGIIASPVLVTYPLIAQVLQRDLREIGLQPEIQQVPVAEWYKRVFSKETDFHLAVSWFAGYGDPAIVMNWWAPGAIAAYAGFMKPVEEYTGVMAKVRNLPNGPERQAAMARGCEIVYDQANLLPLVNKPDYIAYRSDLIQPKFAKLEGNFDVLKYAEEFTRKR
jgi:peptide/nickel transport system substrate-binding protein